LVVDDILGRGEEQAELLWQLADLPFHIGPKCVRLDCEAGPIVLSVWSSAEELDFSLARGQEQPERLGWQSLHYAERTPAPTVRAAARGPLPIRFITLVSLGGEAELDDVTDTTRAVWQAPAGGEWRVVLYRPDHEDTVVAQVEAPGRAGLLVPDQWRSLE